jgi:seryl-tRNA synthetase
MATTRAASPDQAELLDTLVERGLLIPSGVDGVYGRSAAFEDIRRRFEDHVARSTAAAYERLSFPPVLPRRQLETAGYLASFPHLAGAVFAFEGGEAEAIAQAERAERHDDWSEFQQMTDLVLTPAACYPVYPAVAARGALPPDGAAIATGGAEVFRHEPSGDPTRLQTFHMLELVRLGEPDVVVAWRDEWQERALELVRGLGLDAHLRVAADPFFGRAGRMLASSQREQALKFEIQVQIAGPEPTAVASFNYHQDHFTAAYGIHLPDGGVAHSACLGFGEERIVLALLRTHGFDVDAWPASVRTQLWEAA